MPEPVPVTRSLHVHVHVGESTYWLTRVVFLRALSFIYLVAFLVSFHQNEYLIGDNGLTPAGPFLDRVRANLNDGDGRKDLTDLTGLVMSYPTLFWALPPSSRNITLLAALGALLSLFVLVSGCANMVVLFTLWAGYMSIIKVGQTWFGFGWETQLLETGFLAIFLVPMFELRRFPKHLPTPAVTLVGYRWLLFRIMLGAGLIKIRGDQCWRDLTCMNYHYQTQPVPNPLSHMFHFNPETIHKVETMGNHIIELILPFFLFFPRPLRVFGGCVQVFFQAVLISSGNLSFLNWLTILPAITCFDDKALSWLFGNTAKAQASQADLDYHSILIGSDSKNIGTTDNPNAAAVVHLANEKSGWVRLLLSTPLRVKLYIYGRRILHFGVFLLITKLSIPVVLNLMSSRQAMNTSFDAFSLVNTYGAFGSITKVRHEVIVQGTLDKQVDKDTQWFDYEFSCKPGDINRRPCVISPYHYRLDWLMWFAAFQSYQQCPWLVHLCYKLLQGDNVALKLMDSNHASPFLNTNSSVPIPPTFIRAELYEYRYTKSADKINVDVNGALRNTSTTPSKKKWEIGVWWKRKWVQSYLPAISLHADSEKSVRDFLSQHGML